MVWPFKEKSPNSAEPSGRSKTLDQWEREWSRLIDVVLALEQHLLNLPPGERAQFEKLLHQDMVRDDEYGRAVLGQSVGQTVETVPSWLGILESSPLDRLALYLCSGPPRNLESALAEMQKEIDLYTQGNAKIRSSMHAAMISTLFVPERFHFLLKDNRAPMMETAAAIGHQVRCGELRIFFGLADRIAGSLAGDKPEAVYLDVLEDIDRIRALGASAAAHYFELFRVEPSTVVEHRLPSHWVRWGSGQMITFPIGLLWEGYISKTHDALRGLPEAFELADRLGIPLGFVARIASTSDEPGALALEYVTRAAGAIEAGVTRVSDLKRQATGLARQAATEADPQVFYAQIDYWGLVGSDLQLHQTARELAKKGLGQAKFVELLEEYGDQMILWPGHAASLREFLSLVVEKPFRCINFVALFGDDPGRLFSSAVSETHRAQIIHGLLEIPEVSPRLDRALGWLEAQDQQRGTIALKVILNFGKNDLRQLDPLLDLVGSLGGEALVQLGTANTGDALLAQLKGLAAKRRTAAQSLVGPAVTSSVDRRGGISWQERLLAEQATDLPPSHVLTQTLNELGPQFEHRMRTLWTAKREAIAGFCEDVLAYAQSPNFQLVLRDSVLFRRYADLLQNGNGALDDLRKIFSEQGKLLLSQVTGVLRGEEPLRLSAPLTTPTVERVESLSFDRIVVVGRKYYDNQVAKISAAAGSVPIQVYDASERAVPLTGLRQTDLVIFIASHRSHSYRQYVERRLHGATFRLYYQSGTRLLAEYIRELVENRRL